MQIEFKATKREEQGSSASRRLRRAGRLPGVIYGGGKDAVAISMDHNDLYHALSKEAFHSSVLTADVDGTKESVVLRDAQWHPYKQQVLHIDFQRVDANTRVRIKVPLHYSGEESSPAVKTDKCLVSHVATDVEIECLATQLPEFIGVDLSGLVKGQSLHLNDIKVPKGVKFVTHGKPNPVIATVVLPKEEEVAAEGEAAAAAAAPAPAPAKGKGKK